MWICSAGLRVVADGILGAPAAAATPRGDFHALSFQAAGVQEKAIYRAQPYIRKDFEGYQVGGADFGSPRVLLFQMDPSLGTAQRGAWNTIHGTQPYNEQLSGAWGAKGDQDKPCLQGDLIRATRTVQQLMRNVRAADTQKLLMR